MLGVQDGLSTNTKDAGCNSCDYGKLGADKLANRRDLHLLGVTSMVTGSSEGAS